MTSSLEAGKWGCRTQGDMGGSRAGDLAAWLRPSACTQALAASVAAGRLSLSPPSDNP